MTPTPPPAEATKVLVLEIEVPGIWADDLEEAAGYFSADERGNPGVPSPEDYLEVVTGEWMRPEVGLTIVSRPGEKCMNDDFLITAYTCRIIGARIRDADTTTG